MLQVYQMDYHQKERYRPWGVIFMRIERSIMKEENTRVCTSIRKGPPLLGARLLLSSIYLVLPLASSHIMCRAAYCLSGLFIYLYFYFILGCLPFVRATFEFGWKAWILQQ